MLCPGCRKEPPSQESPIALAFCPHCRFPLKVLEGRYRLEGLLGQGGFGAVYLACELETEERCAIKLLRNDFDDALMQGHWDTKKKEAKRNEFLSRFRREVRLTSQLAQENPHIVRVFHIGYDDKLGHYYAMEYLQGQTLEGFLAETPEPSLAVLFGLLEQICDAVHAAHLRGIIHRDLKPDNIFLLDGDEGPFVKLLDFGIAKSLHDTMQTDLTSGMMGTPMYISPEQCLGHEVDERADVYALGGIIYCMFAGAPPFASKQGMPLLVAHIQEPPPAMASWDPAWSIPVGLEAEVLKALSKAPGERQPHAEALWQAIVPYRPAHASLSEFADPATATTVDAPVVDASALEASTGPELSSEAEEWQALRSRRWLWGGLVFFLFSLALVAAVEWEFFSGSPGDAGVAQKPSQEQPRWSLVPNVKAGKSWTIEGLAGARVVWIPPGAFVMGSPKKENGRNPDETPRALSFKKGFWMWQTEVTQTQYRQVMGNNPSRFRKCGTCPVERVTWHEAAAFVNALSVRAGISAKHRCFQCRKRDQQFRCRQTPWFRRNPRRCRGWSLPTEAEWEYAYRAGTRSALYNGKLQEPSAKDEKLEAIAWYDHNSGYRTHPVAQKRPNAWNLFDMAGNVWEWCIEPEPPSSSVPAYTAPRQRRGGSWQGYAWKARAANRDALAATKRQANTGFRPVWRP